MNRRLLLGAPLGLAILGGGGFYAMLKGLQKGTFDPRGVPSQILDKPIPGFTLPGFGSADVVAAKKPVVINFFASWCVPCVDEAGTLLALKRAGVPIWGITYKDKEPATAAFLAKHGNPYATLARDTEGRVGIDWGITGVPETYLIDAEGVVRWRFVGPLPNEAVAELAKRAAA
jgi:cytochrome c biogenesis protein CcmG/thiol:disulfide interchange protein DsbE